MTRARSTPIALVLALAGCDPLVELDRGETTSGPSDEDTSASGADTSPGGDTEDEPSTTGAVPPDLGEPPAPSLCPAGAGDLSLDWSLESPTAHQAASVATGAGRVAWTSGEWGAQRLQVLDLDGTPQWEQILPFADNAAAHTREDLAIDPDGGVLVAGTTYDGADFDALLRWYDPSGVLLAEDVLDTPTTDAWEGVARFSDGDVVLAGESNGVLHVRRSALGVGVEWSQTFAATGATWATHLAVGPDDALYVTGFDEELRGHVLLAYDGSGALQWSHGDGDGDLDSAGGVAVDGQGRVWIAIDDDLGTKSRIERRDATGALELSIVVDYFPRSIAVDADDWIVVVGSVPSQSLSVVERYASNGAHVARYERDGRFASRIAVDEDCHAYAVGFLDGPGAWLERLN